MQQAARKSNNLTSFPQPLLAQEASVSEPVQRHPEATADNADADYNAMKGTFAAIIDSSCNGSITLGVTACSVVNTIAASASEMIASASRVTAAVDELAVNCTTAACEHLSWLAGLGQRMNPITSAETIMPQLLASNIEQIQNTQAIWFFWQTWCMRVPFESLEHLGRPSLNAQE